MGAVMITLCVLLSLAASTVVGQVCTKKSSCSCTLTDSKKVINLSSLGKKDGSPRFTNIVGSDGSQVSYNPCYPFSGSFNGGLACENVAGCVVESLGDEFSLGTQDSATFTTDSGSTAIHYGYSGGHGMLVRLVCSPDADEPTLTNGGNNGDNQYYLTLISKCCCAGMCNTHEKEGVSDHVGVPGLILLLLLIFGFATYFIAGVLYNKYRRGATGLEVIPNLAFWQDFPNLVKEGALFTIEPCRKGYKKLKGEDEQYDDNSRIVQPDQPPAYNYGT